MNEEMITYAFDSIETRPDVQPPPRLSVKRRGRSKLSAMAGLVGAVVLMGAGGSMASIPDQAGVIHACFSTSKGTVRIIDDALGSCNKGETLMTWNEQGPVGAAGPQGDAGAMGPVGPQGEVGPQGLTGPQGEQGPAGLDGAQGDPGPQGVQGSAGSAGPPGAQGVAGPAGPDGEPGISGLEYIEGPWVSIGPGADGDNALAECPSGKRVLGGGHVRTGFHQVSFVHSQPRHFGGTWSWWLFVHNPDGAPALSVRAWAVCAFVAQ